MLDEYKDQFVLVSGLGRMIDVAHATYGYKKVIEIEELFSLFPDTSPGLKQQYGDKFIKEKRDQVLERFSDQYSSLDELK